MLVSWRQVKFLTPSLVFLNQCQARRGGLFKCFNYLIEGKRASSRERKKLLIKTQLHPNIALNFYKSIFGENTYKLEKLVVSSIDRSGKFQATLLLYTRHSDGVGQVNHLNPHRPSTSSFHILPTHTCHRDRQYSLHHFTECIKVYLPNALFPPRLLRIFSFTASIFLEMVYFKFIFITHQKIAGSSVCLLAYSVKHATKYAAKSAVGRAPSSPKFGAKSKAGNSEFVLMFSNKIFKICQLWPDRQ